MIGARTTYRKWGEERNKLKHLKPALVTSIAFDRKISVSIDNPNRLTKLMLTRTEPRVKASNL